MDKNLKIAIILSAIDKATSVTNKAFANAERHAKSLQKMSDSANKIGNTSLLAGTAITAFFGKTIADARDAKIAQDKLVLGFQTMGSTAEQAKKMIDFAGVQEFKWGVQDEDIENVMGKLSTFKRAMSDQAIASGVFTRATQAAFDMQAKGYGDAMSNIDQLGKALQNPMLGSQALSRAGAINKEDLPMIRYIQQTKGIASAQKYVLDAIEKQVKGSAAAMADPLQVMKIQFTEVSEAIGRQLLPIVNKYANFITANIGTVFDWIDKHKRMVVLIAKAGVALLAFGAVMKTVSFGLSGFSTAWTMYGNALKAAQFAKGLLGFGSTALEAGANLNKFQTAGLKTLTVVKSVSKGISKAFMWMGEQLAAAGEFLLANPIILVIVAVAAAALLIYKYWTPIKAFFVNLWAKVKEPVMKFWNWLKPYLLNFTPVGLIIKYWKPLSNFFVKIWEDVKNVFVNTFNWINNLAGKFWDAGMNIVKSVWEGMKSMAHKPVELIADITKKIREYLPFSPAKAGAFRDLHRVKIVETIVQSMKAKPAIEAMHRVTSGMYDTANRSIPDHSVGGHTFNFSPVIHLSGGATRQDADRLTSSMKQQMDKWWRDMNANKSRISF